MTAAEALATAERHANEATSKVVRSDEVSADYATFLVAQAQVHATQAVAFATMAAALRGQP